MAEHLTLLAVLLEDKGLRRYGSFCIAYEKAARSLDDRPGVAPSRAQYHRWLVGDLRSIPYTEHCRVLEHMIAGYSATQLFAPCPDGTIPAPARRLPGTGAGQLPASDAVVPEAPSTADIAAAFASRSEFAAHVQLGALLDGARRIRASGLSLNLICQQVPDQQLQRMLTSGTELALLFLDPAGTAITLREQEEELPPKHLSELTRLNIDVMSRLRDRLPEDSRDNLRLSVYDETIRFNLILIDDHTCVAQPYMPTTRGIDSPTLLIRRAKANGGLYPVFDQLYQALAERSRPL